MRRLLLAAILLCLLTGAANRDKILNMQGEFPVNRTLLHAFIKAESGYNPNAIHAQVTVPVKGEKVTTRAIGLGGIMWVYWQDDLKANGIAKKESDLKDPAVNMRATAYILRKLLNETPPGTTDTLRYLVTRYYGKRNPAYERIVLEEIGRISISFE